MKARIEMIETKKTDNIGQTKIICTICNESDLLLNWMSCDIWNESVRKFREKHENCEINALKPTSEQIQAELQLNL